MRITTPENDIQKVLFTQEQIEARVRELGAELAEEYRGKQPLMVCILKGASVFYTDLCRAMDCGVFMDFIAVSSYGASSKSTGVVRIIKVSGFQHNRPPRGDRGRHNRQRPYTPVPEGAVRLKKARFHEDGMPS